ncbi:hypothetical protein ACFYL6_20535 [Micromonospora sp. NPDC007208]|uniref:hypothetical protein n=1 Tax=Micromonospora sp. NPDC007208 TaxID=3364236 RepID=UPI0036ACB732
MTSTVTRDEWCSSVVVAFSGLPCTGRPGHPILLDREIWPLLDRYAVGDRGARDRPDLVVEVPCDDVGSPVDVDTPADLLRLGPLSDG